LEQSVVPDEWLEDEIILIHGDLATKEKIDGLTQMNIIEKSAKNHSGVQLSYLDFSPEDACNRCDLDHPCIAC